MSSTALSTSLEAEEVLTPSELSSLLRIPRSNTTLVLQKLERASLIRIEEDANDGRQRVITLTEAGTKSKHPSPRSKRGHPGNAQPHQAKRKHGGRRMVHENVPQSFNRAALLAPSL
ncbi:MAG: MarR family winged helix-turn-helix transcriptional regulator [Collinsella sp.]